MTSTARPDSSCSSGSRRSTRSPSGDQGVQRPGPAARRPPAAAPAAASQALPACELPSSSGSAGRPTSSPVSTPRPMLTSADHTRATARDREPGAHLGLGEDAPHRPGQVLAQLADEEDAGRRRHVQRGPQVGHQHPPAQHGEERADERQDAARATSATGSTRARSRDTAAQLRATAPAPRRPG